MRNPHPGLIRIIIKAFLTYTSAASLSTPTAEVIRGHNMVEVATPGELAEIARSASEIGGAVKTLSDLRFEKFKAEMDAKFAALEAENRELRTANAELYAYAQARSANESRPSEPVKTVEEVHAAEVVEDETMKAAEIKKANDYEAAYQAAIKNLGRAPEAQPVHKESGINPNTPSGDGM